MSYSHIFFLISGEADCDSDRELACPAKRRRQDNLLGVSDDESCLSLSRSSSLLQFESFEKQCQDISSSSPSIFSNISFDSLEGQRKNGVSPDSLEQSHSDGEQEYYKTIRIDVPQSKNYKSRDSLLYNYTTRQHDSDSSESADSEDTLEASRYDSCRSVDNLKIWRSFDSLNLNNSSSQKSAVKEKMSAENLSEDSGYSDHLGNYMKNKSSSIPNILSLSISEKQPVIREKSDKRPELKGKTTEYKTKTKTAKAYAGFGAYDGDVFQNSAWSFGVSFHDLSVVEDLIVTSEYRSPLIDRFLRKGAIKRHIAANRDLVSLRQTDTVNIETASECVGPSKYNIASASEPNLLQAASEYKTCTTDQRRDQTEQTYIKQCYFENSVCVSSVPNDLNLAGDLKNARETWKAANDPPSIAEKNWDIGDLSNETCETDNLSEDARNSVVKNMSAKNKAPGKIIQKIPSISSESDIDMSSFKREGSYMEAMSNMLDLSDDEFNPCYSDHTPRSTIVEFDKQILKTISETSIKSFFDSNNQLDMMFSSTPLTANKRNVVSTPNLTLLRREIDVDRGINNVPATHSTSIQDLPRKSSLVNRSTSTSVSDAEEKTLTPTKSFSGSTNSKGVHFSPVVSEVNWQDDSNSPDRESSYSLSSTPEKELIRETAPPTPPLIKPTPRMISHIDTRAYVSQPDLQRSQPVSRSNSDHRPQQNNFQPLQRNQAISQPNLSRRRSSLIQKEHDGSLIKAYTAKDGVMYRHTHLSLNSSTVYQPPTPSSHVSGVNSAEVKQGKTVYSMDSEAPQHRSSKSGRSGLGGFFSRIASFRFPKTKGDEKKKKKSSGTTINFSVPAQRLATKDDYIYIPLKGPEKTSSGNNNNKRSKVADEGACVSAKPPLPKVPPRVVGASVKRRPETAAQSVNPERRTIDSGDALPRPMEPMGLIETDLDTEVTVITSGAHVKTRSLMNLGAEAPPRSLAAPPHPSRPHKSMEFLLDKQNLKVVEVSFLTPFIYLLYFKIIYIVFTFAPRSFASVLQTPKYFLALHKHLHVTFILKAPIVC